MDSTSLFILPETISYTPSETDLNNAEFSVVYLTHYMGSKLPPYYVGSTYYRKFVSGYVGSVCSRKYKKIFESEIREHPELFEVHLISVHDTRKEALSNEYNIHIRHDVVASTYYMNMANAEPDGCFGTDSAVGNDNCKGRIWVTDDKSSMMIRPTDPIPTGWRTGRQKFLGKSISDRMTGKKQNVRWITETLTQKHKKIRIDQPLPDGWEEGRGDFMKNMVATRNLRSYYWSHHKDTGKELRIYEDMVLPPTHVKGRTKGFRTKSS